MKEKLPPLISVASIPETLGFPHVVFVDARGGADSYERYQDGHFRGARFMDLETDLSKKDPDAAIGGRHPLPDPGAFGYALGKAGITPSSHLVVYDDKGGANAAARFWWMMRAAGHSLVQVVDGGLAALQEAGFPIVKGHSIPTAKAAPYPFKQWRLPTAGIEMVDRARSASDSVVIDVRESYRYRGESEPIDPVAGHIPGAINIPYTSNLDANGRFRSPELLKGEYQGKVGQRKVIVHCGSGVTACHTLLAMASAGIENGVLYVGSWSEWSRNKKPLAKGQNP